MKTIPKYKAAVVIAFIAINLMWLMVSAAFVVYSYLVGNSKFMWESIVATLITINICFAIVVVIFIPLLNFLIRKI